jgi:hypothetical protein
MALCTIGIVHGDSLLIAAMESAYLGHSSAYMEDVEVRSSTKSGFSRVDNQGWTLNEEAQILPVIFLVESYLTKLVGEHHFFFLLPSNIINDEYTLKYANVYNISLYIYIYV